MPMTGVSGMHTTQLNFLVPLRSLYLIEKQTRKKDKPAKSKFGTIKLDRGERGQRNIVHLEKEISD